MSQTPHGGFPGAPDLQPPTMPTGEFATPIQALGFAPPARRTDWKRIVFLIVTIVVIAASGIAIVAIIGVAAGPVALLVGVIAAVVPVPFLITCFLWLDRYEPEPIKYLLVVFAWGACVATLAALLVNTGMDSLFKSMHLPENLTAVIVAPIIEETMKAAGPVLLFVFRRRAISGMIDAIVYCGLSATGFAMMENILYIGVKGYASGAANSGVTGGAISAFGIFIGRIVFTGFAHPLFTSMTAIGLGIAARSSSKGVRILAPLAGLIVAMMLHGTWNLMSLVAAAKTPYALLYGYFAVMMPIFFSMVGFALWLRSAEAKVVERVLPEYVRAGWLAPPEVAALGTIGRRLAARRWAKRVVGDPGAKAMRAFQFDATRLALLRDRMHRRLDATPKEEAKTLREEQELLAALGAYRWVFAGRDPQQPRALWDGNRYHLTFPDGQVRVVDAPANPVMPVPVFLPPPGPMPGPMPGRPAPGYPYR